MIIDGNECDTNEKGNWLYYGFRSKSGKVSYVGVTIQRPSEKFSWHKKDGMDLRFHAIKNFNTVEEMLAYQKNCIARLRPEFNLKDGEQEDKLTQGQIRKRKGSDEWCQSCLKRRVGEGKTKCIWCDDE